jgi:hypothetical protein
VLESCNFGYQPHLSQLGVPQTQNFEIPLKTQESKNSKIIFENFNKMLDGTSASDFFKCALFIYIHHSFNSNYHVGFSLQILIVKCLLTILESATT